MVYRRRSFKSRKYAKKIMAKGKSPFRSYSKTKQLVKLINKVSLKKAETKHTHRIDENQNINHNGESIKYGFLYTQQGTNDPDNGTSNYTGRLGNEVVARGLSFKFWIANKLDRPNVMYRIVIFKYRADTVPTTCYKSQGTSNIMLRDLDVDLMTPIKTIRINLNQGAAEAVKLISGSDQFVGIEGHTYRSFYIPLKNKIVRYKDDNSGSPKYYDYAYSVCAYDSWGTPQADVVGSVASNVKFYFKDP